MHLSTWSFLNILFFVPNFPVQGIIVTEFLWIFKYPASILEDEYLNHNDKSHYYIVKQCSSLN